MKVAALEINNFRGIKSGIVVFQDHSVLVGPNNCGKTTLIEAVALVLGRDRLVRDLTEHDFYGSDPEPADRIKIIATITDYPSEDFSNHPDWFRDGRGVPVWYNPETGNVSPERANDELKLACQIGFAARFDRVSLEVETARYFYDGDGPDIFAEDSYVPVPIKLVREIGLFLIPANRTWDRMLSFGSELFKRVIRATNGLPASAILEERDRLRTPQNPLENHPRLKPVVDEVNEEITNLFGTANLLRMRLTGTDSDGVLNAVIPHFKGGTETPLPSRRQGSGLNSLQTLFLLLHFGQKRVDDGESFCLAFEEPELHLPPTIQRRVLSKLQSLSTQTIVSTHSPLVAAFCDPTSLLVVRNDDGILTANPLLKKQLDQVTKNAIRKLYQINRVETVSAVMNEVVLIPEGRYDFEWLSLLNRVVELDRTSKETSQFGVRIGLIPTSDAAVVDTCKSISGSHPKVCCLVDGDSAGNGYVTELGGPDVGVSQILQWTSDWMIEDAICWILEADESRVMKIIDSDLVEPAVDVTTLRSRLKTQDRELHGLKGDLVGYEVIANAIAQSSACLDRARNLLQAISQVCTGKETDFFEAESLGTISRMVFKP